MSRKIIQISTCTVGDNINREQLLVTTVLYDDGQVYEGCMDRVGGNSDDGFKYAMAWRRVLSPDEQE